VLDTLAWVQFRLGNLPRALDLLEQAVAASPDVPVINYHLGRVLFESGRRSEAQTQLEKALKNAETFPGREAAEELMRRLQVS
jgi:predicted Zn-dependent protease